MAEALWAKDLPLDLQLHRFTVGQDPVTDLQLMPFDAVGSAAHARMLGETGLLPEAEARALVGALAQLRQEALDGKLVILPEEEDCHTALEHALTERLGETGKRIHLARSRNDQVATALRLLMRARVLDLGRAVHACAAAAAGPGPAGGGHAPARLHPHAPGHARHLGHCGPRPSPRGCWRSWRPCRPCGTAWTAAPWAPPPGSARPSPWTGPAAPGCWASPGCSAAPWTS